MRKMMIQIAFVVIAILVVIEARLSAGEIVILGNNYKIPKIYEKDGTARGILINIARYIDQQMEDHTFVFHLYPWARAYQSAVNGNGGIIGLSKTKERLAIFDYSDVVYYDEVIIVVKQGREFLFRDIADLKGKVVGIGRGGSFGDEFEQGKQSGLFVVEEDNGPVSRLKKVLAGRIDCALISPGWYALRKTISQDKNLLKDKDDLVVLPVPFRRDPNFLGFVKTLHMQGFLHEFNQVLKHGYETGAIQRIIDQDSD